MIFYLSFCDPKRPHGAQFLGALYIEATDTPDALARARKLGLNPGGEVLSFRRHVIHGIDPWMNRLLTREELTEQNREYARNHAGDLDEPRRIEEAAATREFICAEHNVEPS